MSEILDGCFLNNIDIRSINFDGAASNVCMAQGLGAHIYDNTEASYFKQPVNNKIIYTFLQFLSNTTLPRFPR